MVETKFIDIDGIKLFYTERNTDANHTIFFLHGNSTAHQTWKHQLNSPLLSSYRLIAFDLPAHGLSDAAMDITDSYSLSGIASLMTKVVTQLADGKSFLLAGVSLGTNIVSEMLSYLPQPIGIVLVSPCVISTMDDLQKVFLPNPNAGLLFQDEIEQEELEKLARDFFFIGDAVELNRYTEDFLAVKAPFRSLLMKSFMQGKVTDQIALLQKSGVPLLVVFGGEDKIVNQDYLDDIDLTLWKDTIFQLPEACHFVHIDHPGQFNRLLAEYAADRFTQAHS